MAIPPVAYGFPLAAMTADKLPIWMQPLSRFAVGGSEDWKVSTLASIDRGIRIEAGTGSGDGVTETTFEYETLSVPKPPIASMWYTIVRRRNWTGTGTGTFVAVPGTAAKAVAQVSASGRRNVPGTESDQPIALVRVTQKDSTVLELVDLRCWASNGGVEVVDKLALDFLGTPGAAVKLGQSLWRYEKQANNLWTWREYQMSDRLPDFTSGVPAGKTPIVKFGFTHLANHDNTKVATNASGDGYHYFPKPFPEALVSCIVMPSVDPALFDKVTENYHFNFNRVYSNNSRFSVRVYNKDGNRVTNGSGLYVQYIAIGY